MNTEQKAAAYDEANKWMESVYPSLTHEQQMEAEAFFPELAISHDEKIRKEIKMFIISHSRNESNGKIDAWIAWLEKQGEQKPDNEDGWEFEKGKWYVKTCHTYDGDLRHFQEGHVYQAISETCITDGYHHVTLGSWQIPKYFRPATKEEMPQESEQKPTWKPSEEQLNIFAQTIHDEELSYRRVILTELLEQLKAL